MPVRGEDVRAQNSGIPVMLGETMSFVNEDGRVMGGCTVALIQGEYVGCGKEGDVREWWRMTEVLRIQKVPK
jgi:hypothetical protein